MSNAQTKNAQAMESLLGSAALVERLSRVRIAIVTPDKALSRSGLLLARVLTDTLARLWPNIDFAGADAASLNSLASIAAASGKSPTDGLHARWEPPYDVVVAIACDPVATSSHVIRAGGNDWTAALGPTAQCGDSANPVGPALAASLAASQVFLRVFATEMKDAEVDPIKACSFDAREICQCPDLVVRPLDVGKTTVFGVGAVTHGMMLLLEMWPESVTGTLELVDKDKYGDSNGQRYAAMTPQDVDQFKATSVRSRLRAAHPDLEVHDQCNDMNSYCSERGYEAPIERAVAGLDSAEARRQVALKLPERTINMWTGGIYFGAGRYQALGGGGCLACDYLEDTTSEQDEVALLFKQLQISPDRIRDLLDSGRGLYSDEAMVVAQKWRIAAHELAGQPLRSILPKLCATERIQLPGSDDAVDVPFAFASLGAGIAGFMMLLKDLHSDSSSEGWTQHTFKVPTALMHQVLHSKKECVCCREMRILHER